MTTIMSREQTTTNNEKKHVRVVKGETVTSEQVVFEV